ncbi:hypothetical protein VARIO8X_60338 [Burkholderiales bacterium 8X]|nr:hypothetical protein VARIO8X_60338 [Burkholderiales bacterium 8X]
MGQGFHLGCDQGSAGFERPQDASFGDAGAGARDGHGADAIARCGARASRAKNRHRATEETLIFLSII